MTRRHPALTAFLKITAVLLVLMAALFVYSRFDPQHSAWFPKCPFRLLTGFDCPGCGSQRAVYQLLHGNIAAAFHYNALLVLSIPYIILGIFLACCSELPANHGVRNFLTRLRLTLYHGNAVTVVLFVIIAFWILRNTVDWL